MSFVLFAAGVLLLSISFLIISYSLIWCYTTVKSVSTPTENSYQENTTAITDEEIMDMYSTPSIKRFDDRMERLKMELAATNIPENNEIETEYDMSKIRPGVLYDLPAASVDEYIKYSKSGEDEVSI